MIFPTLPPRLPFRDEPSCCTCARLLSEVERYGEDEKKLPLEDRTLKCCGRVICGVCIQGNERFAFYCPYCPDPENFPGGPDFLYSSSRRKRAASQDDEERRSPTGEVQSEESASSPSSNNEDSETSQPSSPASSPSQPPSPESSPSPPPPTQVEDEQAASSSSSSSPFILHHLHPHESLPGISLLYNLPVSAIRKANSLSPTGIDDRLLFARKTLLIPGRDKSLSTAPPGGEEAERKRLGIRRWMMATKEPEYDVAKVYLEGTGWDVDAAVVRWFEDGEWERGQKGAGKRRATMGTDGMRGDGGIGEIAGDDGGGCGKGKGKGWLGFWGL